MAVAMTLRAKPLLLAGERPLRLGVFKKRRAADLSVAALLVAGPSLVNQHSEAMRLT